MTAWTESQIGKPSLLEKRDVSGITVDVVVNNYEYASFLNAAIDSALSQTHPHVRVVVVDDGSTDRSREIIGSYGEKILPILKRNGGQASAFNAGFAQSRGDVVIFLDSDDVLLPETCARVAAAFATEPSAARVHYPTAVIDGAGKLTGVRKPPHNVHLPAGDFREHMVTFPFDLPWVATSGNAFSSAALRQIFPVPEDEFRILADAYVVHLTTLLGTVVALDQIGAYRRVHQSNLHERAEPSLDLAQIRQSIVATESVRRYLHRKAVEIRLTEEDASAVAVSDVGNRIISLRLAPDDHPFPDDTRRELVATGVRASLRRFDVAPPMRVLFIVWILAESIAPRAVARVLANLFLFPERRKWLNTVLVGWRRY